METEREKLRGVESEHYQTEQLLDSSAFSCREEEEQLQHRLQRQQEQIENQRRIFDDLEFQQLEVGG